MWKKHPRALPYLFFSEMWERFGYYLMIGIFTLYLKDKAGFEMSEKEASNLYGTFIALVFFTPFIGGLLADRILGYRVSVIFGGLLMGVGYCLMGVHNIQYLYVAMSMVIIGNGFFKPNISTLLGNVYSVPEHSHQKDEGYNIFYMGINVGAFICNFFGAALYITSGWYAAFFAAGVGMFIGVIVFLAGTRHYKQFDVRVPMKQGDMSIGKILGIVLLPSLICGIIGWFIPGKIFDSDSTDAFIFACIPVIIYYTSLYFKAGETERKPMGVMLVIFAVVVMFWAVFKQNGSAMNTWADNYTERRVTGNTETVLSNLKLTAKVVYAKDSTAVIDAQFRKKKENNVVVKHVDYPSYFNNYPEKKELKEGEGISVWSTNISQSFNPFWVIVLTPVVVFFFTLLRKRKKEPSIPSKITLGIFVSALSVLVMVAAVYSGHNGSEKVSWLWLFGSYFVITIGELMLSPMGLSMVSKLSPQRFTSLMMGGWFLATSIGNKLSGILASQWDSYENKANYFWLNFALLLFAALLLLAMLKRLNQAIK
ncbi:MAG: peptide MFS transporter [Bacteroidetes bacterium]|nr:peptide MFS transporter [Bacteroidota bacterium]